MSLFDIFTSKVYYTPYYMLLTVLKKTHYSINDVLAGLIEKPKLGFINEMSILLVSITFEDL